MANECAYIWPVSYVHKSNNTYAITKEFTLRECVATLQEPELWNCRKCGSDDDYFNPFIEGDKIYLQYLVTQEYTHILFEAINSATEEILPSPSLVIENGEDTNKQKFINGIFDMTDYPDVDCIYFRAKFFKCVLNETVLNECLGIATPAIGSFTINSPTDPTPFDVTLDFGVVGSFVVTLNMADPAQFLLDVQAGLNGLVTGWVCTLGFDNGAIVISITTSSPGAAYVGIVIGYALGGFPPADFSFSSEAFAAAPVEEPTYEELNACYTSLCSQLDYFRTEPYKRLGCMESSILIEGHYDDKDCNGNYYGPFVGPLTNSFIPSIRIPAEFRRIGFQYDRKVTNSKVVSNTKREVFKLRSKKVPEYVAQKVDICFAAENYYIEGVEYINSTGIDKNFDEGTMWLIDVNVQKECKQNGFTCK